MRQGRRIARFPIGLSVQLLWAEREREHTMAWAQSAFTENRHLTDRLKELVERIPSIIEPDLPS